MTVLRWLRRATERFLLDPPAGCDTGLDPLDIFPGGVCLPCYAKDAPVPTTQDVVKMWGGVL